MQNNFSNQIFNMDFSKITNRLPFFLRNKYIFTVVVFLLWLLFFDKTNVVSHLGELSKIQTYKHQIQFYEEGIRNVTNQLNQLNTDNLTLEKFAREQYYLKKEGEDIFLIEE